ncbi:hypothetical protein KBX63_04320 [Micromonospora sp. U21]|nr:hypothetical protein [Micromonospora sp. U21]
MNTSLLAESSLRSERLDGRLKRAAAALTVVASAALLLDIAAFLLPDVSGQARVVIVSGVTLLAAGLLGATISWSREATLSGDRVRNARRYSDS